MIRKLRKCGDRKEGTGSERKEKKERKQIGKRK
jgi:hypothetical protein